MKRGLVIFLGILLLVGVVSAGDVNFIFPTHGGEYNNTIININWSYSSNLTDNSTCSYNLNDGIGAKSFNCLLDNPILNISSIEGDNNWTINIKENSTSSIKSESITFFVDSISPVINVLTPSTNPFYTSNQFFNLMFGLDELNPNYYLSNKPFKLKICDQGQDIEGLCSINEAYLSINSSNISESYKYNNDEDLSDGNYTYIVRTEDTISHETILDGNVILDTTPPLISLSSPAPNTNHSGSVSIEISATDALSGIQSTLINISNGTYTNTSTSSSYSWDSTQVSDGTYTITATATDKAGNSNSTSITIEVDNTAPSISFNSPPSTIYNSNQTINITASDVHLKNITLFVDGGLTNFTTGEELLYELGEGNHSVNATACDTFDNCNPTETRIIEVDTVFPELTNDTSLSYDIFSPANSDGFFDSVDIIMNASELIKDWGTTYLYNSSGDQVRYFSSPDGSPDNITSLVKQWDGKNKSTGGNYVPDGIYTINTTIIDRAGNPATVYVGSVEVDNTAPVINLTGNSTITLEVFDSYVEYGATANDSREGDLTSNMINDSSLVNMSEIGIYVVTYFVEDNVKNNATITRTINVTDTTAPTINLTGNETITIELGSNYTEQGATATDVYDGDLTSNIVIDNSSVNTSKIGSYNVTYNVDDSSGNSATEVIRTVMVQDTTPPTITPLSPLNNKAFAFDNNDVQFNYSYVDESSLDNCSLFINNSFNQAGTSNFTLTGLSPGAYTWNLVCNDSYNNNGSSSTQSFTILSNLTELSDFSEYTNLTSEQNISDVLYFFVNGTYGMINFTEAIDFSSGFDWTQFINISNYKILVDSPEQPLLNKSATITFYNVTLVDPEVMKDGSRFCHSTSCYTYDTTSNTLTITVTEFSEYTLREYVAPVVSTSSSSSGGGGGSTTYWTCVEWGEWSECVGDEQTRNCLTSERATYLTSTGLTETRTCTETTLISSEGEPEVSTTSQEEITQEESTKGLFGVTGAAITDFADTGRGKISIAFTVLLLIGGIGFIVYRRKFRR